MTTKHSPSESPVYMRAWLELPFPVWASVDKKYQVTYQENIQTELKIEVLNDAFKVVTGNQWKSGKEVAEWSARMQAGEDVPPPIASFVTLYASRHQVAQIVSELQESPDVDYIHVDTIPSVVKATTVIPIHISKGKKFATLDLMPQHGFFQKEILARLQEIVTAYRIAVQPWIRYSILPVSEALVDRAMIEFLNRKGDRVGVFFYGFDPKSTWFLSHIEMPDAITEHFDQILAEIEKHEAEDQMASAYYLYRMRRWAEAVAVASAVVDQLLRDLVDKVASTPIEAEAISKAYRYEQLFKDIFPAFGLPRLPDTKQKLWQSYQKAKKYRGAKVHGEYAKAFDEEQQLEVKEHLSAFHDVARWLKQQLGLTWALDSYSYDENGEQLDPFP